jgi:Domain of unknown function (DUF305)
MTSNDKRAVFAALGAAVLFGAGTPSAKLVLGQADPWLVAGLKSGKDPKMRAMARRIIDAQKKEIQELDDWLARGK